MIRKKEIDKALKACNTFTEIIILLSDKTEDATMRDRFIFAALAKVAEVLVNYINEDPEVVMQRLMEAVK